MISLSWKDALGAGPVKQPGHEDDQIYLKERNRPMSTQICISRIEYRSQNICLLKR